MTPLLVYIAIMAWCGASHGLTLTRDGYSDYVIVVPAKASPSEKHAAAELQHFLREISGAELPITADTEPIRAYEIVLGNGNTRLDQLNLRLPPPSGSGEWFRIGTAGERLLLLGAPQRGTMYGVYTFLEDHLGCRWLSSKVSRIPKQRTIELEPFSSVQTPVLEYREPFYWDAFDADWAARNKVNSQSARLDDMRGGKVTYYPFVHTFYSLIPPEQYFAEHPEYFAEVGGKRVASNAQLCLTNPDVVRLTVAKVREWIETHPGVNIVSVSQNDCWGFCECPNCRALAEAEGSQSAPIVAFVNQVAEAIENDYPNVAIDTLAYSYSRKPPKTLRPRGNVIIRLCTIECCFSHPLATCDHPQNVSFRDDMVGWSKLCNRLYVWDYVTSFAHYLTPFPNWDVLQPNIKFFVDHGVKGIFEEGNYNSPGGEFAELRAYIMAKCLWDPDYDADRAMDEFLEGYYGLAARPIGKYIDLLTAKVRKENIHLHIWEGPNAAFLTEDILARANHLFDEAETLVRDDPEVLHRVQVARIPLLYVALSRWQPPSRTSWVIRDGRWGPPADPVFGALVDRFFRIAEREGITCYHEGSNNLPVFRDAVLRKRDGIPVIAVGSGRVFAAVAPSAGARIVSLREGVEEYAAAGGAYTVSLSRSANGPGSEADFQPIANSPADRLVLSAKLDNGLILTREFSRSGELRITSIVTNTSNKPADVTLRACLNLNLGPPDATVLASTAGPLPLVIPAERKSYTFHVPTDLLPYGLTLANGETTRRLRLSFADQLPTAAVVTTSVGSVPLRVDLYTRLSALAPGQAQLVTHVLSLGHAKVRGARQPTSHRGDVIEVQDDQFLLYKEGELSEFVMDETASDGWAARQLGSDLEWSVQWPIEASLFEPLTPYKLLAVVKIDRTGSVGKAFDFGVYDTVSRAGILGGSRNVVDMPPGWHTVEMGTFVPSQGAYVWTAPPRNSENVAWVYVDKLVFVRAK